MLLPFVEFLPPAQGPRRAPPPARPAAAAQPVIVSATVTLLPARDSNLGASGRVTGSVNGTPRRRPRGPRGRAGPGAGHYPECESVRQTPARGRAWPGLQVRRSGPGRELHSVHQAIQVQVVGLGIRRRSQSVTVRPGPCPGPAAPRPGGATPSPRAGLTGSLRPPPADCCDILVACLGGGLRVSLTRQPQ